MSEEVVRFRCVKEGSRLRIRIITPGYNSQANCQFPRNIRKDGCEYTAPVSAVTFSDTRGNRKFFYRVAGSQVKVVDSSGGEVTFDKIFESSECVVCMDCEPSVAFAPCGHFCVCSECSDGIRASGKCPMCRSVISNYVAKNEIKVD